MNKADLIDKVAQVTTTKKEAKVVVEAVLSGISDALADGDSVNLIGFGTFKVSQRAARQGRNPRTGENVYIPAKKVPRFVAGKALKDAVK